MSDKFDPESYVKVKTVLQWVNTKEPDENGKFSAKLTGLSAAAVEAVKAVGIVVKNNPAKGDYVPVGHTKPFKLRFAVDAERQEYARDEVDIGNGTEAEVVVFPYAYKASRKGQKDGVSAKIQEIVITKLVPFVKGGGESAEIAGPAL